MPLTPFSNATISPAMRPGQAVNPRDAVADLEHLPHFAAGDFGRELLDLTLDD